MSRTVAPRRWQRFMDLLAAGHSLTAAARAAGIGKRTARAFLNELRTEARDGRRCARRSSGWLWLAVRDAERAEASKASA